MRWTLLIAMLLASPAYSLSCTPPDPVQDYKAAEASSARWGVAVGQLSFNEGKLPKVDMNRPDKVPEKTTIRAQFVGHSLNTDGFKTPFQANVTLQVSCILTWCGTPRNGARYLAFIKHEGNKRVVFSDPCGSRLYPNPSRQDLQRIRDCFVGGPCRPRAF